MTDSNLVQRLNRSCYCVGTDLPALRTWLQTDLRARGVSEPIVDSHPHLFSSLPVFVSAEHISTMRRLITAIESVVAMPTFREFVLSSAPAIARHEQAAKGVLLGYDFHITESGPQLIEINTNAGGVLLNVEMARAQQVCCDEVKRHVGARIDSDQVEKILFQMFKSEWQLARRDQQLKTVAIVDSAPSAQYLYPEFLLFQKLFETHGVAAFIVGPEELRQEHGALFYRECQVDLVYNRLTDFYFENNSNSALREAYLSASAVITPHPRAHGLYASKLNLTVLTNEELMRSMGIAKETIDSLIQGIPRTLSVKNEDRERWWTERKQWFFKPINGFGSRGSYRGDKITRGMFADVLKGDYVAQAFSPPSERWQGEGSALKFDIRSYVYAGEILLTAARLYQGQTTNFRTMGGGFAPVYAMTGDRKP